MSCFLIRCFQGIYYCIKIFFWPDISARFFLLGCPDVLCSSGYVSSDHIFQTSTKSYSCSKSVETMMTNTMEVISSNYQFVQVMHTKYVIHEQVHSSAQIHLCILHSGCFPLEDIRLILPHSITYHMPLFTFLFQFVFWCLLQSSIVYLLMVDVLCLSSLMLGHTLSFIFYSLI